MLGCGCSASVTEAVVGCDRRLPAALPTCPACCSHAPCTAVYRPVCVPQKFEPYCKQASFNEMLRDPINAGGAAAQRGYQRLHIALQVT